MKANELKIGSTYYSVKWHQPVVLTAEDITELVRMADGASIDYYIDKMFEPIRLNKKELLKFGFEITINTDKWQCFTISIDDENNFSLDLEGNYEIGEDFKQYECLYYVHQLQNIYHALKNTELKFKNETEQKK